MVREWTPSTATTPMPPRPTSRIRKTELWYGSRLHQRQPLSFEWCLFIVAVAAIIVLRFAWPTFIMLAAMLGLTVHHALTVVLMR